MYPLRVRSCSNLKFSFVSISPTPFGVKIFAKIRVDRPIVPLNISTKTITFLQIRVNREFFAKKNVFSIFCARKAGWGEIFLAMKFFSWTLNDVSWKFWKSEIKDISLYSSENTLCNTMAFGNIHTYEERGDGAAAID